jgi:hypothetical protein
MESSGTPENSELDCKGQNTSHWGVLDIIGKVSKCRCPKWPRIGHFGHLQPKLWAKERSGVKLAVWLSTTKSRESTRSQCAMRECNIELESSRGELQDWFRTCPDRRSGREVTMAQSPGSPNRDSFGTSLWESRDKEPLGRGRDGAMQRILYGGRWWFPLSSGHGESSESKVARGLSQHQKGAKWVLTNLWLVFDAGSCNKIIVTLPSLIPGLLAHPSYPPLVLEVGSGSKFQLSVIQHTWTLKWV